MVRVLVSVAGPTRPPNGAPVVVQVRDTTLQDAAATVVAQAVGRVGGDGAVATVDVPLDDALRSANLTLWVHVDVDGDGRVSPGDYITTQSIPVPPSGEPARVPVKRV